VAPHALGHTDQLFVMMWEICAKQIGQLSRGEMPGGIINKEVWTSPGFQAKLKKFLQETR